MSDSLPIVSPSARRLTEVLPQMIASLSSSSTMLPPARGGVLVVIDGLGRHNLRARSGHARFLSGRMGKKDRAITVFPSTTASALTSLLTGTDPGQHGLVGYRVRVPGTRRAPDQLRGFDRDGLDPLTWQRARPLLDREAEAGRPCFVVSSPEYAGTGLTTAIMRGAEFVGVADLGDRLRLAAELASRHPGALVYTYIADLDRLAHRHGWESDAWSAQLELVDDAVRTLEAGLAPGVGALVIADHGLVDVPAHRHVLLGEGDALLDNVDVIAGEPRMLHLYTTSGSTPAVLSRWREGEGHRSWVLGRDEAIANGLFGSTDPEVRERIGDVIVAARAAIAYYDDRLADHVLGALVGESIVVIGDRLADKGAQNMVGQHGSLTDQERVVPLLRLGAYAQR